MQKVTALNIHPNKQVVASGDSLGHVHIWGITGL
jgi:hypothetical protein